MLAIKGFRGKHQVICFFIYVNAVFICTFCIPYVVISLLSILLVKLTVVSLYNTHFADPLFIFFFVVSYYAAEETSFALRDYLSFFLSFSELSSVIFLNWLWITEVSLQVSVVADGEAYLSASVLHVCVHVCYVIWVTTPHNPVA